MISFKEFYFYLVLYIEISYKYLTNHEIIVDKEIQGYRRENKVQNGISKKGNAGNKF